MSNEAKAFISKLGDAFHPDFNGIDHDHDGKLSKDEIIADLTQKEMVDVDRVKASDLPEDIKKNVAALLEGKLKSDSDCARQALDQRQVAVSREDHEIFYYLLDVFCPRVTIAVTPPDQLEEGIPTENQQTVEIPTPDGGTTEVIIIGEPEDGKQTIAIPDEEGGYTTTEVRSIETPAGEHKILIPNAEGDITPVVVPELPTEVTETTANTKVVDVVTSTGETEQVIIVGEPEHGKQTVQIPDNEGGYTETEAKVVETSEGKQLVVETTDGDIIHFPVPGPISIDEGHFGGHPYTEEEPVQQVIQVTTSTGEQEQVTLIGEPEHGEQKVEITDESGRTTVEEVKVTETASGETKLDLPEVDTPVIVPEVPAEVVREAEKSGETAQVVDIVTPSGETQQVIIEGEPEHGKQTVEIVDQYGQTTTTEVRVEETSSGEKKIEIPTSEGYVAVDLPEPVPAAHTYTEEEPVQQVIQVTTTTGEQEQVTLIGEPEHGEQKVEITDESGRTTVEEVKVTETASGETKLDLPVVDTPVIVPEVPAEVVREAEKSGETAQVVDIVTPSGETQQVIIEGEPEHGKQTVEIVDQYGQTTTTEVRVEETSSGEKKIEIPTSEGYVAVDLPEPVPAAHTYTEEEPVQQVIQVTTSTGEQEQVTLIGEPEHGEQKVEITDESGRTTVEEVKVTETASGETKLDLPEVDTPVIVPEVPAEVVREAEKSGETAQVVDIVTPSGETQQVIIEGEPEHGKQTVEIVDQYGQTTTTEVRVEETSSGEKKIEIPTSEGYVAVDLPEPVPAAHTYTEEEPVQQVIQVTTSTGEQEQVTLIGEPEHGEQKVEITDESGRTTVEEVKVTETASGETKLDLPEVDTPVIVPEVPAEVVREAEKSGETAQVVDIVTPSGETQQVIIEGEPEHGKQTVEIVDQYGQTTTTEVRVEETSSGEKKIEIPTSEGYVAVDLPEPVPAAHTYTEEEPVQQVIQVTTTKGEQEQVTLIGEPEHGEQKVEITDESGRTTVEEVKVTETASGETKLDLPEVDTPMIVPEVPAEVVREAEKSGETAQVVDIVTPSGETQQVIIEGEPEHGKQTVEIVDQYGQTTTTEVRVEETSSGEKKIEIPTSEGYVAVDLPEPVPAAHTYTEEEPVQQVIQVTTSTGEQEQVTLIGEPEHGEQKVEITDESGRTTVEEVKVTETASGETKLDLPEVDTPVIVPEVPAEVVREAEKSGETAQVVDIVTPSGETQQVIIEGEPEHGKQTVEIVDQYGQTTTTEVRVEETSSGEKKIEIPTSEGYVAVDLPEPVPAAHTYTEEEPVQQVIQVTTSTGEQEQVTLIGEPEHGEQKVEITDESGRTTVEEVKVTETASGETKLDLPEVDTPVIVPEVPAEVVREAEKSGETAQVVDIVTPSGETQQVIIEGEPEHGKQTVEIVDQYGQTTTTEVRVEETSSGEKKIEIPTSEGYVAIDLPEPVPAAHTYTEEEPVQQVIQVTTSTGEQEQVTLIGEPEHGEQKVEITDESGRTTVEEVKVTETASGETKLDLPEVDTPVIVPEVPAEVVREAEKSGETAQVVDIVTPSGETQQVIIEGEPEHGKQTVEIVDQYGQTTTTEVRVEETSSGEKKIEIPTSEGYVAVDLPEPVPAAHTYTEEEPVQQVIQVTTTTGEQEQVTLIGEPEHGEQKVEITDESGRTTVEEVKVTETASGETKLDLPEVGTPVIVPEVPAEVVREAEKSGETAQVVDIVTPSGETQQVIIEGEPEHGKQTVEIVDQYGQTTTTEVRVEETSSGEKKIEIPTSEGYVAVDLPEPVPAAHTYTEEEPVQQVIQVTTSTGEQEQVTLIGEPEHGEQKVEITDESGRTTVEEVKVTETASGETKLDLPEVDTPVIVPEVPAEVVREAEKSGETAQVVDIVTPSGETQQVIIEGEPEHGKQTVEIVDQYGQTTTTEVRVEETSSGEKKIEIPTSEGYVAVDLPEPVPAAHTYTEEEPVQQVIQVTTSTGEQEQVTLIGEPEHGEQKVEITDESGRTTVEEVKVTETASGETKLDLPEVDTPVIVPEVPAEVVREAEKSGETAQVVDIVTPSGETQQVIIEGEPEHGKQTVEIVDQYGQTTTTEVRVEETSSGEKKIEIPTSEGYVAIDLPEPVPATHTYTEEEPVPVVQTVDVVTANGEHEQVIIVGEVEDGKQTIKILNEEGGYTTKEVKAVENSDGEKLVIPDGDGGTTLVEVPEVPAEIASTVTEDTQVVNVVTPEGNQLQVIVEGEPEHGEQTVQIVDEHGEVTTEQVKAVETSEGLKLEIKTDEGYVAVEVPEVPVEIKQEIAEEQQESKYMTKDEFRDWIAKHYQDKLSLLEKEEQKLEEEARAKLDRMKGLQDCIVQAANKFGYYGVYEQPPHFQNAVNWIQSDCWTHDRWEPESPPEHPMLRR
ncbi:hypothetical protein GN958_ATG12324 [Phytophthora infestans]|uniref:EF-hand domain-containing protein n=1 Tax=Phytophthora infestans TaxID=4787 RepID=A0A8S9UIZ9_PHYIN|nr:hypothetical protein GN958_ATG12324 [Phytophthora infestans]